MRNHCLLMFLIALHVALVVSPARAAEPLVHEVTLEAPVDEVWRAFTTQDGIESWMVPNAEIDLRIGGTLKTSYHADADLDGPQAIHHEILSFEPERMLSMRVTKAPEGFPFADQIEGMWSTIYLSEAGPDRTHLRVVGLGYDDSAESQRMRAFFDEGNRWEMQRLREHFASDESAPASDGGDPLEIMSRMVGGEWIHEAEQPGGGVFRVRNVIRRAADGIGLVGAGWLGDRDGMFHHSSTLVYRQPGRPSELMYLNLNETGAIATGAITSPDADVVEWDWRQQSLDGTRLHFLVRQRFTGTDAYTLTILGPANDETGARPTLVEADFERVDEAPERFRRLKE